MARSRYEAKLGVGTAGVGQGTGVEIGHDLVVAAVKHQGRSWGDRAGQVQRADVAQLTHPTVRVRRKFRRADQAHRAGMVEELASVPCPRDEVRRGGQSCDATDFRVVGSDGQGHHSSQAEPGDEHLAGPLGPQLAHRIRSVLHPAAYRKVPGRTGYAPWLERQRQPLGVGRNPVRQPAEGLDRSPRQPGSAGEVRADDNGQRPASRGGGRWPGEVAYRSARGAAGTHTGQGR
jgi:hypothetical protein